MSNYYMALSQIYEHPNFNNLEQADQLFVSDCLDVLNNKETLGFQNNSSLVQSVIKQIEENLQGVCK